MCSPGQDFYPQKLYDFFTDEGSFALRETYFWQGPYLYRWFSEFKFVASDVF